MKIPIFKEVKKNAIVVFILLSVLMAALLICSIPICDTFLEYLPFLCYVLFIYSILYILYRVLYRDLQYTVYLLDDEIQLLSRNKVKCTVDLNKPVYALQCKKAIDRMTIRDFVLVSNAPIVQKQAKCLYKGCIKKYDPKTQILIPNTKETRPFFRFSEWILCFFQ